MVIDNPDVRAGHHEHLYLSEQVSRARHEMQRSWTPMPVIASCQICGGEVDLTKVIKGLSESTEDLPPVRGAWSRRARPQSS